MLDLTRQQVKTLAEIASRPNGRPEAYYTFSGARNRVLRFLLNEGLIERVGEQLSPGATGFRLVATEKGKAVAAQHMTTGEQR